MSLSYNGYTFSDRSHIDVSTEPVYDDSDRSVTYLKHMITVQAIVIPEDGSGASAGTTANTMQDIRRRLTKPGQRFSLTDSGFGPDIVIGNIGTNAVNDVNFGPKPRMISWKPIGNTVSAEVTWQCEVCIPDCEFAGYEGVASFHYSVRFSLTDRGHTTRTTSGHLEIAAHRKGVITDDVYSGTREISDSADNYRHLINVTKPANFKRQQDYELSADKRRLRFTIVDTEIQSPNAYPPGVSIIEGNHRVRTNKYSRTTAQNSINVSIQLDRDQPKIMAWEIFRAIVNKRISHPIAAGLTVMFEDLEIDEPLFAFRLQFSLSYRVIGEEIRKILTSLGLYRSLGYSWETWAATRELVEGERGLAQLSHDESQDELVDLCTQGSLPAIGGDSLTVLGPDSAYQGLCNEKPDPEKSYVHFEATLIDETEANSVTTYTLGEVDVQNNTFDPADPLATLNNVEATDIEAVIAEAAPGQRFRWKGYMERMGYPIPTPDILQVGDVTLKRVGKGKVGRKLKGVYFCQRVYSAAWNILYEVTERPQSADGGIDDPTMAVVEGEA